MPMRYLSLLVGLFLGSAIAAEPRVAAAAQSSLISSVRTQVIDVTTNGTSVRYLMITPSITRVTGAVILFAGGDGFVNITYDGQVGNALKDNFLVRTRTSFAERGLAVALIDPPGATAVTASGRISPEYAATMTAVIADFRRQTGLSKVWLVSTSAGTLSVANIASRYPLMSWFPAGTTPNAGRPDGIILTSTLTVRHPSSIGAENCPLSVLNDVALSPVNVPVHMVQHVGDTCPCSPYSKSTINALLAAFTHSPTKDSVFVDGPGSDKVPYPNACTALTQHGFLGVTTENTVVGQIVRWATIPTEQAP